MGNISSSSSFSSSTKIHKIKFFPATPFQHLLIADEPDLEAIEKMIIENPEVMQERVPSEKKVEKTEKEDQTITIEDVSPTEVGEDEEEGEAGKEGEEDKDEEAGKEGEAGKKGKASKEGEANKDDDVTSILEKLQERREALLQMKKNHEQSMVTINRMFSDDSSDQDGDGTSGNSEANPVPEYPLVFILAKIGNVEVAKLLVRHGADLTETFNNMNALHFACINGNFEMIDYLMENGLRPETSPERGISPLAAVAGYGTAETFKYLSDKDVPLNEKPTGLESEMFAPIKMAIRKNRLDIAEILLDAGVNVDEEGEKTEIRKWMSPTEIVVAKGNVEMLKLFARKGANLHKVDNKGLSLLHIAVRRDSSKVLSFLIEQGLDVNAQKHDGWTPLMLASMNLQVKCVSILIEAKADLSLIDNKGKTALHRACRYDRSDSIKIIQMLLDAGADLSIKSKRGETPLALALRHDNTKVVNLLQTKLNETWKDEMHAHMKLLTDKVSHLESLLLKTREAEK